MLKNLIDTEGLICLPFALKLLENRKARSTYLPVYQVALLSKTSTSHFIPAFPIWSHKGLKNAGFPRDSYIFLASAGPVLILTQKNSV